MKTVPEGEDNDMLRT